MKSAFGRAVSLNSQPHSSACSGQRPLLGKKFSALASAPHYRPEFHQPKLPVQSLRGLTCRQMKRELKTGVIYYAGTELYWQSSFLFSQARTSADFIAGGVILGIFFRNKLLQFMETFMSGTGRIPQTYFAPSGTSSLEAKGPISRGAQTISPPTSGLALPL